MKRMNKQHRYVIAVDDFFNFIFTALALNRTSYLLPLTIAENNLIFFNFIFTDIDLNRTSYLLPLTIAENDLIFSILIS